MQKWRKLSLLAAFVLAIGSTGMTRAQDLRIALQDDPDSLDPAINQSFVGRHVLQSLCDKLVDLDEHGQIIPMLATSWSWSSDGLALSLTLRPGVLFHDGTIFDAEAVSFNLNRALNLPASRRKAEVEAIAGFEVTGPLALTVKLKRPSIPLLSALTDRAGMMVSPTAAATGDMTAHPVCAGPYSFVERRAQERIVLARVPGHWRAGAYHFERLMFRGQPDSSVRLLNLRAGQFDIIERLAPADVAATEADKSLKVVPVTGLGYYNLTFNLANGSGANPALTPEVRRAIDLAIDRNAINQVAFDGRYQAGNQPFPPESFWYNAKRPVRAANIADAKKLMGGRKVEFTLMVPTDPERGQVAQMIQAMLAEIGITVKIQQVELISLLERARQGQFEAHIVGWSGRADPDLNITPQLTCGASLNDGKYCNPAFEALLTEARAVADPALRKPLYDRVIGVLLTDVPTLYLYHSKWIYAHRAIISGMTRVPDGVLRLDGVKPL